MAIDPSQTEVCWDCGAAVPSESWAIHSRWHQDQDKKLDDLRYEIKEGNQ